jgi:hypothetical protein
VNTAISNWSDRGVWAEKFSVLEIRRTGKGHCARNVWPEDVGRDYVKVQCIHCVNHATEM